MNSKNGLKRLLTNRVRKTWTTRIKSHLCEQIGDLPVLRGHGLLQLGDLLVAFEPLSFQRLHPHLEQDFDSRNTALNNKFVINPDREGVVLFDGGIVLVAQCLHLARRRRVDDQLRRRFLLLIPK